MTYLIGIDSGSTATKGILLADGVIYAPFPRSNTLSSGNSNY